MTVSVRMDNGGVFGVVRSAVHAVASPLQELSSVISTPFKALSAEPDGTAGMSEEDVSALKQENEQLRVLVAQLEEYRQQDQRLTALLGLSDSYGLETVSGRVLNVKSGWDHTATISVGSDDGVRVGMGVMSSCGLYGQVESVSASTSVVRLITDADSSVSAMIQGTRATGIITGSYDGTLIMEYVSVDSSVGEGDIVITSGAGGSYPRGIVVGTVGSVEKDSSKMYYRIIVNPISSIRNCEEVLVLTGNEDSTKSLVDKEFLESILAPVMGSSSAQGGDGSQGDGGQGDQGDGDQGGDGGQDPQPQPGEGE
ncbi:MAG: rod shape-determining protein MreC [Coriobacteriales bacterium]